MAGLPDEMLSFVLKQAELTRPGAALGQLLSRGRPAINTPTYVVATSRGALPHVSHDLLAKHTSIKAAYFGLEDCKTHAHLHCGALTGGSQTASSY